MHVYAYMHTILVYKEDELYIPIYITMYKSNKHYTHPSFTPIFTGNQSL